MKTTQFIDCTLKDKLRKKLTIAGVVLAIGGFICLFWPPVGILFMLMAPIAFFLVNPGDVKGPCPVCSAPLMGYKKSKITACGKCHAKISVDHDAKVFFETGEKF